MRRRLRLFPDLRALAYLKGASSEVGLIYPMPSWQSFLSVILATPCMALKGILTKNLESAAMVRERDDWGYYVRAIRDLTHPPSWRWRIIRRGNPMGVLLEAGGFSTYEAARFAGNVALADFLEQLEREKLRND